MTKKCVFDSLDRRAATARSYKAPKPTDDLVAFFRKINGVKIVNNMPEETARKHRLKMAQSLWLSCSVCDKQKNCYYYKKPRSHDYCAYDDKFYRCKCKSRLLDALKVLEETGYKGYK